MVRKTIVLLVAAVHFSLLRDIDVCAFGLLSRLLSNEVGVLVIMAKVREGTGLCLE